MAGQGGLFPIWGSPNPENSVSWSVNCFLGGGRCGASVVNNCVIVTIFGTCGDPKSLLCSFGDSMGGIPVAEKGIKIGHNTKNARDVHAIASEAAVGSQWQPF